MNLDARTVETLSAVSTATLTTILLKKGLRNVWMRGTRPLQPNQPRLVGRAFTLRFVPAREDLATPAVLVLAALDPCRDRGHAGGAASRSWTRWGSPMPASSATSSAPE